MNTLIRMSDRYMSEGRLTDEFEGVTHENGVHV